jgi:hypothetical protein
MKGITNRQEQEKAKRECRRGLLYPAIVLIVAALLLAAIGLAFPMTAGSQAPILLVGCNVSGQARGWQITEIALTEDLGQTVLLPQQFQVLGVALNAQGVPVLAIQHRAGQPFDQEWRALFLAAGPVWDVQLDGWWYIGAVLWHGWLRYLYLQPAPPEPLPSFTPTPSKPALGLLPAQPGPRGPEPPFLEKP